MIFEAFSLLPCLAEEKAEGKRLQLLLRTVLRFGLAKVEEVSAFLLFSWLQRLWAGCDGGRGRGDSNRACHR